MSNPNERKQLENGQEKTLAAEPFVWLEDFHRCQERSWFEHGCGDCEVRARFEQLKSCVDWLIEAHDRVQRVKSEVGRLRGTLAPIDQQPNSPFGPIQQYGPWKPERRYPFEVKRNELIAAQSQFEKALQISGCCIRENGYSTEKRKKVKLHTECEDRLYKHNLICAERLFQRAIFAFQEVDAYVATLPTFAWEIDSAFAAAQVAREAFHKDLFIRAKNRS